MADAYARSVTPPPPERVRVREADSQALLYGVLQSKRFVFLRRDGLYGAYCKATNGLDLAETVPEPGMLIGGGFTEHMFMKGVIVGRLEDETPRGPGTVTYPDYLVQRNSLTYSVELKTPWEGSFKDYLSRHFYKEAIFISRGQPARSIMDEIIARRRITPLNIHIVFLFDIRNVNDADQALIDLKNSIVSLHTRRDWWERNIFGVMLYSAAGLTKVYTVGEVVAGAKLSDKGELGRMDSFFSSGSSGSGSRGGAGVGVGRGARGGTGASRARGAARATGARSFPGGRGAGFRAPASRAGAPAMPPAAFPAAGVIPPGAGPMPPAAFPAPPPVAGVIPPAPVAGVMRRGGPDDGEEAGGKRQKR